MPKISTASIEEGLDFAASLVTVAIEARATKDPAFAPDLAIGLAQYVRFRYVGELQLALEMMADLGNMCGTQLTSPQQFWHQLQWIATKMELEGEEYSTLSIPTEHQQ
jgi:hypothetical protein